MAVQNIIEVADYERRQIDDSIHQFSGWLLDPLSGVIDPETRHSIVGDGLHTRKLSMQEIRSDSERFYSIANLMARWFRIEKVELPDMLVGVEGGGNRLATTMVAAVDPSIVGIGTEINENTGLHTLNDMYRSAIKEREVSPRVTLIGEIGLHGKTMVPVIEELRDLGVEEIDAAYLVQRSGHLPALDEFAIKYSAMVALKMPVYTPEQCENEGYCAQGSLLN